jgi:hypothetical protein
MTLNQDEIQEIKKLFLESGEVIDDARAVAEAQRLLTLVEFCLKAPNDNINKETNL